jgi:eukaryotic-like serine/threonine-protein kinase
MEEGAPCQVQGAECTCQSTLHLVHLALVHPAGYHQTPSLRSSPLHQEAAGSTPDAFGPFRVLHQIGAGALGPVFRGYDPERERLVAIKLFRLELPPERVHQLVGELERLVAANLTRPGIAAPLATGIDGNTAYLVQEFITADSLDVLIRDYGAAPPAEALQVAVQLAGALDFAAVVNVTHGALHPRDVLLSTNESRMTGLGVAAALERVGQTPPVRRPYTAPERIAGGPWDRRADVFSLAAILFEMLSGRRVQGTGAHAADSLTELAGADLPALRKTFARALAEKPADRFDTALEFAAALRDAFPDLKPRLAKPADQPPREVLPVPLPPPAAAAPIASVGDAELRAAESARFHDVEVAPAILPPDAPPLVTPRPPASLFGVNEPLAPVSVLERSRSALWPLALALVVGLALGFAVGYGVGNRDRTAASAAAPIASPPAAQPPATAQSQAPAQPVPTTGREFTDNPVVEAPKPAASTRETSTQSAPAQSAPAPAPARIVPQARETRAATARTTVTDTGRLLVRSTPAGARVFVDGRDRGRTPATVRDLARGAHRVRVVQEGYATEERRVVVSASQPAQSVSVALTRTRAEPASRANGGGFVGSLSVDSLPPAAKVFVDGRLVGTTPLLLPQIGAGTHVVRLEHDGYRHWSSPVRVVSGERNRVTASLEK